MPRPSPAPALSPPGRPAWRLFCFFSSCPPFLPRAELNPAPSLSKAKPTPPPNRFSPPGHPARSLFSSPALSPPPNRFFLFRPPHPLPLFLARPPHPEPHNSPSLSPFPYFFAPLRNIPATLSPPGRPARRLFCFFSSCPPFHPRAELNPAPHSLKSHHPCPCQPISFVRPPHPLPLFLACPSPAQPIFSISATPPAPSFLRPPSPPGILLFLFPAQTNCPACFLFFFYPRAELNPAPTLSQAKTHAPAHPIFSARPPHPEPHNSPSLSPSTSAPPALLAPRRNIPATLSPPPAAFLLFLFLARPFTTATFPPGSPILLRPMKKRLLKMRFSAFQTTVLSSRGIRRE